MQKRAVPEAPQRWSAKRKADLVEAVTSGDMSRERARELYGLSEQELLSWQQALSAHGVAGLRICAPERRKSSRRPVREPALAVFVGSSRIKCMIKDIAEQGARVEFRADVNPPKKFVLQCVESKRASWVTVVWRNHRHVGLRFDPAPPIDPAEAPVSGPWLLGEV